MQGYRISSAVADGEGVIARRKWGNDTGISPAYSAKYAGPKRRSYINGRLGLVRTAIVSLPGLWRFGHSGRDEAPPLHHADPAYPRGRRYHRPDLGHSGQAERTDASDRSGAG